jgi:CAAX prenyl protease-like protein
MSPSDSEPSEPHTPLTNAAGAGADRTATSPTGGSLVARYPWAVFIVPYAVFVLVNALEPTPESSLGLFGWTIGYESYPAIYTAKIALVMVVMAALWPGYRQFPCKVSPLAAGVGVVGAVVWVSLCRLQLERTAIGLAGLGDWISFGARSAFNPLDEFADRPLLAYGFLAVRFWGLSVVLPIIEEFFLRGFVMRYFFRPDWWNVPFGTMSTAAIVAGTVVPILTHPTSEVFAVAVWFSLVTWLMWRTRNIWDCVVAHMITNLLLGVWVVVSGDWYLM